MTDWIANGESGASVRAKLNGLMIPLGSGSVSSPVPFITLNLPAGYGTFLLLLDNMRSDFGDQLTARFSFDGGVTYPNEDDGYISLRSRITDGTAFDNTIAQDTDTIGYLGTSSDDLPTVAPDSSSAQVWITPGTANATAHAFTQLQSIYANQVFLKMTMVDTWYKEAGIVTNMQVGPYFDDGINFTNLDYQLFGVV